MGFWATQGSRLAITLPISFRGHFLGEAAKTVDGIAWTAGGLPEDGYGRGAAGPGVSVSSLPPGKPPVPMPGPNAATSPKPAPTKAAPVQSAPAGKGPACYTASLHQFRLMSYTERCEWLRSGGKISEAAAKEFPMLSRGNFNKLSHADRRRWIQNGGRLFDEA